MSPAELQRYLHTHIPISKEMGVKVVTTVDELVLSAPLAPNINHRETVFGGSASALAILSAWSLVHCRLKAEGISARLVIQQNSMSYERPIQGEFQAKAAVASPALWRRFVKTHRRMGRGRVQVSALLSSGGEVVGRFSGAFVTLPQHD